MKTIETWMTLSKVTFGTSGARGKVEDMTDLICYLYTLGFIQYLKQHYTLQKIALAGDLRASTPRIMAAIANAIEDAGLSVVYCGFIPTPALALYGIQQQIPSLMVTGSHIPDDRNGIKFYTPLGEILKTDETAIKQACVAYDHTLFDANNCKHTLTPLPTPDSSAERAYIQRYVAVFSPRALAGMRIGLYQHSSVLRDIAETLLCQLGAEVICLARSDVFIPVDTEAIRPEDVTLGQQWAAQHDVDALVSMDGDGDRPLIGDAQGRWLRGDIAGLLCAHIVGAKTVVTPVSANTAVEKCAWFTSVRRTKIGSPYVIEAMQHAAQTGDAVVGYEANGGFLIQTPLSIQGQTLAPLPTRDAIIVALAILVEAKQRGLSVAELCTQLPPRFTASGRIKAFPTALSQAKLALLSSGSEAETKHAIEQHFPDFGRVKQYDQCDGLRITFENDEIMHLRPSGNAPEFRCYNEAASEARAEQMNRCCLNILATWVTPTALT